MMSFLNRNFHLSICQLGGPNCSMVSTTKASESRNEFMPTRSFLGSVAVNITSKTFPKTKINKKKSIEQFSGVQTQSLLLQTNT